MQSLDGFLKGPEAPVVEQPKAEEPKTEVKAETPEPESAETKAQRERDEKGRFKAKEEGQEPAKPEAPKTQAAPKVEKKAEPTPAGNQKETEQDAELPPKGHVPVKAVLEERKKRQALERQLAALTSRPAQAQPSPAQEQQQEAPDISAVAENLKVDMSAAFAKRQYPDFEEVMQEWPLLLHDQPWLYKQAIADEMPAEWAYKFVKRQRFLQEVGHDPEAWAQQQRAAIRAELEAEAAGRTPQSAQRPAPPAPPPSLATAPSTGNQTKAPEWSGPPPLSNVFKRR